MKKAESFPNFQALEGLRTIPNRPAMGLSFSSWKSHSPICKGSTLNPNESESALVELSPFFFFPWAHACPLVCFWWEVFVSCKTHKKTQAYVA